MVTRTGGVAAIALILAALGAAAIPRAEAIAQPDPAAKIHVESTQVNLTANPSFTFAIAIPSVLKFVAFEQGGQRYLHVWAYSTVDSLDVRIRRASQYLATKPGIFTPLFESPNRGDPILGYVDRLQFERALRDLLPARRLSYNRRLT